MGMDYLLVAHDPTLITLARSEGFRPNRSPNGIRTRVSTLRGWCPRPLDDGARHPFGPSQTIRSGEIFVRVTHLVQSAKSASDARAQNTAPRELVGVDRPVHAHRRDDVARVNDEPGHAPGKLARGGGLEPPITGPEPAVLPITPPPIGRVFRLAQAVEARIPDDPA